MLTKVIGKVSGVPFPFPSLSPLKRKHGMPPLFSKPIPPPNFAPFWWPSPFLTVSAFRSPEIISKVKEDPIMFFARTKSYLATPAWLRIFSKIHLCFLSFSSFFSCPLFGPTAPVEPVLFPLFPVFAGFAGKRTTGTPPGAMMSPPAHPPGAAFQSQLFFRGDVRPSPGFFSESCR